MSRNLAHELNVVKDAFSKNKTFKLRQISNKILETAALYNDEELAEISIVAYCLHKLSSKDHIVKSDKWNSIKKNILSSIESAIKSLKKEREKDFEVALSKIILNVNKTDRKLGYYIQNLHDKARVKQASRAYSLGLSLSQAASLTKADKGKLLPYVGGTKIYDADKVELGIKERLKKLKQNLVSE